VCVASGDKRANRGPDYHGKYGKKEKDVTGVKTNRGELYERLRREVGKIKLVDAHEHLPSEEQWLARELDRTSLLGYVQLSHEADFSSLLGYVHADLVSAGMPKEAILPGMSGEEKWKRVRPFWRYVRNTGAGSLCRRVLSTFFDVDDLSDATLPIIQEGLDNFRKSGIYRRLLKEQYNFAVCVNVVDPVTETSSSEFFAPLLYTSNFASVQMRSDIERLEDAANQEIYSLQTYLRALDTVLELGFRNGLVGIKWHKLAYLRDINYSTGDAHAAEKCLDRIFRMPARGGTASNTPVGFDEMRPFQDFIQHYLVQRAIDLDLPVQIHTGTLGGSHGAQISHTNPTHLVDLFLRYPQARFDLLHASYPYMREATALVKLFPNVYINTAWFEILSPRAAKQYLREWLTTIPTNKIFAFGGDHKNIFFPCVYAEMVRDNLSEILTDEISEGGMSEEDALDIASSMLRENAWEYFRLQDLWANRHEKPATTIS
jgi:hypothetical protein